MAPREHPSPSTLFLFVTGASSFLPVSVTARTFRAGFGGAQPAEDKQWGTGLGEIGAPKVAKGTQRVSYFGYWVFRKFIKAILGMHFVWK